MRGALNSPFRRFSTRAVASIVDTVFNMGGVQYQQADPSFSTPPDASMGWFTFTNVVQESSDTPLLDIVGLSNANSTTGDAAHFSQISVNGYMSADAGRGWHSPGRVCHYVQISTGRAQRSIRS